jgi:uncharacterized lipoprotein YddW (UPF0748 family)
MQLTRFFLSLFWLLLGFFPSAWAATEVRFAVVREAATENDVQWLKVKEALRGINFRVVPLSELNSDTLQGIQVLFLPSIETISPLEVSTLSDWVTRGGKVVVSGSLAAKSAPDVQQQLQQVIGANALQPVDTASPLKISSTELAWKRADTRATVPSGLILTDLNLPSSQFSTIARWDNTNQQPAVLVSPRVTYLGWQWGSGGNPTYFDRSWLTASVERYIPGFLAPAVKIEPVETLAMRKELENLLGRVENITRNSPDTQNLPPSYEQATSDARAAIGAIPKLIKDNQDAQARAVWESAIDGLWRNYPIVQTVAPPEVRAIWLDRGTIVQSGSPQGLRMVFDRLARAGINTVFFETLNAGYTIYPSQVAPEQNPLTIGWDPLASAVTLAHERGMELHAWCWTFATGNSRHNRLIGQADNFPGPVLSRYPQWGMTDNQGSFRPRGQNEFWLDPANPEVRSYLLRIYDEILTKYDVDGLQLDYIRYPFQGTHIFGYSQSSRYGFAAVNGVDPLMLSPGRDLSLFKLWNQYKAKQVSDFVGQVSDQLKRTRPRVLLSTAVYPFVNRERMAKIQQDWETWARQGHVDMVVPMTYKLNTRALQQEVEPILNPVEELPSLFLPSVNLQDLPQVQLRDQIQAVRDLPSEGYSLFAAAHLNEENNLVLSQAVSSAKLIPYRQPLQAVQERFKQLDAEWTFLRSKSALNILTEDYQNLQSRSSRLQQTLRDLANAPSIPKIRQARSDVQTFRVNLQQALKTDRYEGANYRNQTWDNRLAAMDLLLRYSELVFPRMIARR